MRATVWHLVLAASIACRSDHARQRDSTTSAIVVRAADSQASATQGMWLPPHVPGKDINVPATVTEDWLTNLGIGAQRVVFEETPLDSLQARLGAGPIGQAGDAASFVEWLCFSGGIGPDRWVLWLEAGETDAGTVGSFHMVSVRPEAQVDRRCTQLQPAGSLVLPKGLKVGLDDSTVHRLLGSPSARVGDTSIYYFERQPPAKDAVRTRVVLVTDRSRVVQIAAWRSSAW